LFEAGLASEAGRVLAKDLMAKLWIDSHVSSPQSLPLGQYHDALISAATPFTTSLIYLLVVVLWSSFNRKRKPNRTGASLRAFVALHNLALMLFSLLTFYHSAGILSQILTDMGSIRQRFCDGDNKYWRAGFFYWGWLFYLSKYYEVIDTAIILVKGRIPSLLQSYHHAGAIVGMWSLIRTSSPGTWIFVTLNSFVHTVMYAYYILTTLGYKLPGKRYITYMQIVQFFVGSLIALLYLVANCATTIQNASMVFNLAYVAPLTFLFYRFAQNTYAKRKGD
ncbi:hypothetical protein L0F63_004208, partial [Massospora cicadina]